MVKFTGENNEKPGGRIIGLGISRGNVERLEQGKPILVKGEEIGFPDLEIVIFFKETDKELTEAVRPFLSPDTKIHEFKDKNV